MDQVDVVLLTKNSEHALSKCLQSIYQNVPVKNLIVIDAFSTDGTLQIINRFQKAHGNILLFQADGSRAKARTEGIRHVTTDWFLFVDSDVVLCKDWYDNAKRDLKDGVAAVWGLNVDVIPSVSDKFVLRLQGIIARECFKLRGGTHDTLILTAAVKGITIPTHLHTYEDAYIIKHVKQQGYKVAVGSAVYCLHYKPPTSWSIKTGFQQAIVEFKCGLVYSHLYTYTLFYPAFLFNWMFQVPLNWVRSYYNPKPGANQTDVMLKEIPIPRRGRLKSLGAEDCAKDDI